MTAISAYVALFFTALAAATIFPLQSEAVFAGMMVVGQFETWLLVIIASAGNILGSVLNWTLGRWVERFRERRWFPIGDTSLLRARSWYRRFGKWSLLLSWVPIIGDPITMVAGVMREPLLTFLILVTIAKSCRYIALALTVQGIV